MLDFKHLNKTLEDKKNIYSSNQEGFMKIFSILFFETDIEDIDFDSFTMEDLTEAENELENNILFIDDVEDVMILDEHPLAVLDSISRMVFNINQLPKKRFNSPFRFI